MDLKIFPTPQDLRAPRFYFIPLSQECLPECGICLSLGCRNHENRTVPQVESLIARAKLGEFNAVVFSSSFLRHEAAASFLALCQAQALIPILQIHWEALGPRLPEILDWCAKGLHLNIVFTGHEKPIGLSAVFDATDHWHITLAPRKDSPVLPFLANLSATEKERLYFQFTPYSPSGPFLTASETLKLTQQITAVFPDLKIRPPLGREVWDPRISPSLSLDSDATPSFTFSLDKIPDVSVVIPSFNSGPLLKNVIRHLLWQNLPRFRFEIIVVDDGSTDGTLDSIRNFIAPESGNINFKFIYFPRAKKRRRGDGNYRAGIARNLGVKHARGKILAFLDADIIVPPNYLEDLLERHKRWDVIQSVRLHLKNRKKNEFIEYKSIDREKESYVLEPRYWGFFFQITHWDTLPFFWKYTCTYSLSVKTEHFKRAGWFKRSFVFYGFEDTELGYRLAKLGFRFFLNPLITYHLAAGEDRTEYRQSNFERHLVLSKTAKVFFLNTLDPEIFRHFYNLMHGERSAADLTGHSVKLIRRGYEGALSSIKRKIFLSKKTETTV